MEGRAFAVGINEIIFTGTVLQR